MRKKSLVLYFAIVMLALAGGQIVLSQEPATKEAKPSTPVKDIDPLALQVLKAATDRIHNAKAYSFHVIVSRENLGTNGQVITQFSASEFTVEQPNKLRVNFRGRGTEVQLLYNAGQTTLFTPESKLYNTFQGAATIDGALDNLQKRDIFLPSSNFLESDPYKSLTKDLIQAYVIGRVEINGETVHQLAFVEPHAEWQLWVTGGTEPTIKRLEVINKAQSYRPRTVVEFSDWNFNASPDPALFTFNSAGATQIGTLKGVVK